MSNNNIFQELGEVKGRLGAVEQTVSRIETKLDNFGAVSVDTFEKYREEVEFRLDNHEARIDDLEKRAIINDNSFMRKLGAGFENKLVGWIIGIFFTALVLVVVISQQHQIHGLVNEISNLRSK